DELLALRKGTFTGHRAHRGMNAGAAPPRQMITRVVLPDVLDIPRADRAVLVAVLAGPDDQAAGRVDPGRGPGQHRAARQRHPDRPAQGRAALLVAGPQPARGRVSPGRGPAR